MPVAQCSLGVVALTTLDVGRELQRVVLSERVRNPFHEHRVGGVCGGDALDVVNTRPGSSDGLLGEEQLRSITCKTVVLPDRDVGGLDLRQLTEHQLVAWPVGVGAGLRCVLVLADDDEPL